MLSSVPPKVQQECIIIKKNGFQLTAAVSMIEFVIAKFLQTGNLR